MIHSPEDQIEAIVLDQVPGELLRDMVYEINEAYRYAHDSCQRYCDEQAHDLLPHVRRTEIEHRWRSLSHRHGVDCHACPNDAGNCFHVRLASGAVVLTQSVVDSPQSRVRSANFRDRYMGWTQRTLFGDADSAAGASDTAYYGIVIHGPHPTDPERPGFVHLVFPTADGTGALARFDLYKMTSSDQSVMAEEVPDDLAVRLTDAAQSKKRAARQTDRTGTD